MFSVRVAGESDAGLLSELGTRLFVQAFGSQNTAEDMQLYLADAFTVEQWRADLTDRSQMVWVAIDEANVALGYAVLRVAAAPPSVAGAHPIEIARLYADERWHGHGVGGALMSACVTQARDWSGDVAWLGVWDANARAIAFYQKHGFRIVGAQSFLLGTDVQSDHLMARPLD